MSRAAQGAELFDRPTEEAVRLLALAEVERARTARSALERGDDPEALHDFRVALRRLRSQLRAYRGSLGNAVPKRLAKELKALAAATSGGRDAEAGIQLLGILPISERIAAHGKNGRAALVERLATRLQGTLDGARTDLVARFDRADRRLTARLSELTVELAPKSKPERFRSHFTAELRRHHGTLDARLDAIGGDSAEVESGAEHDDERVHAARIEAKRLRYLMDPVVDSLPEGKAATARLRDLQDLLGELNDLRVLAAEVGEFAAELEQELVSRVAREGPSGRKRRPRERAALLEVSEQVASRRSELRERLATEWVDDDAPQRAALDADLDALEAAIAR